MYCDYGYEIRCDYYYDYDYEYDYNYDYDYDHDYNYDYYLTCCSYSDL